MMKVPFPFARLLELFVNELNFNVGHIEYRMACVDETPYRGAKIR